MTDRSKEAFGILSAGGYLPRLRLDRAAVAAGHRWMWLRPHFRSPIA